MRGVEHRTLGLATTGLAALLLAACSQGEVEPLTDEARAARADNGWRAVFQADYDRCMGGDAAGCEELRAGGMESDLFETNYLVHLRDIYARQCGGGDDDACVKIDRLIADLGQIGPSDTYIIDDGDRLWWRACMLEFANDAPQNACRIVFGYSEFSAGDNPAYAENLRADHKAGGQEGLLSRVTDGAVVGTVPDIDPDAVAYMPPADDRKE